MAISWITAGSGLVAVGTCLTVAFFTSAPQTVSPPLQSFNIDPAQVAVVGVSSGGAMAIQAAVAYSDTFHNVGVFSAGPYYCSEGSLLRTIDCMGKTYTASSPEKLIGIAKNWSKAGLIDPVEQIARQKVYLFYGTKDSIIPAGGMQAVYDFYAHFTAPSNILYDKTTPAGHGWISPYGTNACEVEKENYLNRCDIDPEQRFLSLFYGELAPKNDGTPLGKVIPFDQNEFFDNRDASTHSADRTGYAYVPANCAEGQVCKLVLALHGCNQDVGKAGMDFILRSGINQWADTNRIVVVYPQLKSSNLMFNPHGCWDWVGYDGKDFPWRSGTQVKMLKRIADRVSARGPQAGGAG